VSSSWPADAGTSAQSLDFTMQKNQPFDAVQIYGTGNLALTDGTTHKTLADFSSDSPVYRGYMLQAPIADQDLTLQTSPAPAANSKDINPARVYEMGFFQQVRYPFNFDNSWQKMSLAPVTSADQNLDALLNIRQAFYSSDQQTFMAAEGNSSGQTTIPAMHIIHIVGPAHSQSETLSAVTVELNVTHNALGFMRMQLMDPQAPLHSLASVDIHLNDGPGMLRIMLDHRDVTLPSGARPVISLTFSKDTTIDLANSIVRYQWRNAGE
jgi:hypothetical protein